MRAILHVCFKGEFLVSGSLNSRNFALRALLFDFCRFDCFGGEKNSRKMLKNSHDGALTLASGIASVYDSAL
jgi:hypothetical protein